ncbi:MAG: hypothetical protein KBC96_09080 [Armatimonadetes bacterium]|nr:hypothetical protein [Armatimonadota bacterium]
MDDCRTILNDPDLIAAREAHFARLRSLFAGGALPTAFVLHGVPGVGASNPYTETERWMREAAADLAAKAGCLRDAEVFRPPVIGFGPYGVHFVDRMFGAHVYELHENNWQVRPLDQPIGMLATPDMDGDDTWALARRAAEAFLGLGVSVPLFGLPTIASALNVALNLYGQEILLALHERPEAARRDLKIINDLLCFMHTWFIERLPFEQLQPVVAGFRTQPPGHGQLCGCSTQLLPPGLYRDFVAELDDALLGAYPYGGMIHLCGTHTQHIPVWKEMRSLKCLQLNDRAAEDLQPYFEGLRDDQVFYVNPCPGMTVERIMEITGGRRVVIVADIEPPSCRT